MKSNIVIEFFPVRRKVRWYPWRPNDMKITVIGPMYFSSLYQIRKSSQASLCFSLNCLHYSIRLFNS